MEQTQGGEPQRSAFSTVSLDRLKELLDYDPETGIFRWKIRTSNKVQVGDIAGSVDNKGYTKICIGGHRYPASALAWLYMHGELAMCDHEDNNPGNDAIANLRKATYSQNNHRKYTYNPLGHVGVRFRSGRYHAHIRIDGRITRVGSYDTVEEAAQAYKEAATKHFGGFAND